MPMQPERPSFIRKELFWEFDVDAIDPQQHAHMVVARVAQRGNVADIRALFGFYGAKAIADALLDERSLDKRTLALFANLLQIPESDFRCYAQNQSDQNFWPY